MTASDDFVRARSLGEAVAGALRSTVAVRERCGLLLDRARIGQSAWFTVDEGRMREAADAVARAARGLGSDGSHVVPPGPWQLLRHGGPDRLAQFDAQLGQVAPPVRARALVDATVVATLLGGAAPPHWHWTESATGARWQGPQGLAVAALHAFTAGMFSSDPLHPCQVDARGLRALLDDRLAAAFQVHDGNPLPVLPARALLLRKLGEAMAGLPEVFEDAGRPAGLYNLLIAPEGGIAHSADVDAHDLLSQLLAALSGLWPLGHWSGGVPLGDVWRHAAVRVPGPADGWVPFHLPQQRLAHALLEPFAWSGVQVRGIERLTALPGLDAGGLLLDTGVLQLRDPAAPRQAWHPGDEIVVEWRALTLALLDELAPMVHRARGHGHGGPLAGLLPAIDAAGAALARERRGGAPALSVDAGGLLD